MVVAVNDVGQQRLQEALQLKGAQRERWWRLREAALAAISTQVGRGLLGDDDGEDGDNSPGHVPAGIDVRAILNSVLEHDLQPRDTPPFLRGRALWVAAKLASALPEVRSYPPGVRRGARPCSRGPCSRLLPVPAGLAQPRRMLCTWPIPVSSRSPQPPDERWNAAARKLHSRCGCESPCIHQGGLKPASAALTCIWNAPQRPLRLERIARVPRTDPFPIPVPAALSKYGWTESPGTDRCRGCAAVAAAAPDRGPRGVQEQAAQLLAPAVECLAGAHEMPVRVCACRAVSQLLPRAAQQHAQPHLHRVYTALIDLTGQADQDVLNLVLDTLHVRRCCSPRRCCECHCHRKYCCAFPPTCTSVCRHLQLQRRTRAAVLHSLGC